MNTRLIMIRITEAGPGGREPIIFCRGERDGIISFICVSVWCQKHTCCGFRERERERERERGVKCFAKGNMLSIREIGHCLDFTWLMLDLIQCSLRLPRRVRRSLCAPPVPCEADQKRESEGHSYSAGYQILPTGTSACEIAISPLHTP